MKNAFIFSYIFLGLFIFQSCTNTSDTYVVKRQSIQELIFATGTIQALDSYLLTAQTDGVLLELTVREGDDVSGNQRIGSIDNPSNDAQYSAIQEQLAVAELNASTASPMLLEVQANIDFAEKKLSEDKLLY